MLVRYDEATESSIALDALYILDYQGGRLIASLPTFRQSTGTTTIIDSFVERDLAADFKLDLDTGPKPHFLMTTGSLGPFTAGWAPLYVIETTSNQLAVYRLHLQETSGKSSRPKFELVQLSLTRHRVPPRLQAVSGHRPNSVGRVQPTGRKALPNSGLHPRSRKPHASLG